MEQEAKPPEEEAQVASETPETAFGTEATSGFPGFPTTGVPAFDGVIDPKSRRNCSLL